MGGMVRGGGGGHRVQQRLTVMNQCGWCEAGMLAAAALAALPMRASRQVVVRPCAPDVGVRGRHAVPVLLLLEH